MPVWVNLGKSKITPLEEAHLDYAASMERLWRYADLFVINVSSPNTPNLRELQEDEGLIRILTACRGVNDTLASTTNLEPKPLLVKIAPDLTDDQGQAHCAHRKEPRCRWHGGVQHDGESSERCNDT